MCVKALMRKYRYMQVPNSCLCAGTIPVLVPCSLQVLFCKDNLAIVSGLNSDAPVGTKLSFVTGGVG